MRFLAHDIRRRASFAALLLFLLAGPSMAAKNSTVDTLLNAAILLGGGPRLEKALGELGSQSLEEHESISADPALNARAKNIVNRLLTKSARTDLDYQVKVLNKSEVNAYALPGGHIYVNEGMLRLPGVSDNEIAYVLGHELAHTNKGHGVRQMKNSILTGTLLKVIAKDAKVKLYGEMAQQLFLSGRSRKDELEADAAGFDYAASAGYDPAGGLAFMRRLETLSTGRKDLFQQFFATHPPSHDRAEILKSKMLAQEYGADFKTPGNMAALGESSRYSGLPRSKIGLLTDKIVYLGDDRSGENTVWSRTFYLTNEEVSRCTSAKIKFQVKAIPRKDPIVCINRTEIGRAVAKSDQWEVFEFAFDPKSLRGDDANLIDLETFIPDMWRSYDDCEVRHIWLVLALGDSPVANSGGLLDGWYSGDGHVHSRFSCYDIAYLNTRNPPMPTPADQSGAAKTRKLDWIILTDHEYMFKRDTNRPFRDRLDQFFRGYGPDDQWTYMQDQCNNVNAKVRGGDKALCLTWAGEEAGSCDPASHGHYLCYGISGYVETHKSECKSMIQSAIERGGFGFIAHPFNSGFREEVANLKWDNWDVQGYSGVELINCGKTQPYALGSSKPNWDQHLTEDVGEVSRLAKSGDWDRGNRPSTFHVGVGNSDAHWDGRQYYDYLGKKKQDNYPGRSFTWVRPLGGILSKEGIFTALRQGRCVASTSLSDKDGKWTALGALVACRLEAANRTAETGDVLRVSPSEEITITIDWAAASPVDRIRVIGDGGRELASFRNPNAASITEDTVVPTIDAKGGSICSRSPQLLKSLMAKNLRFISAAPVTQTVQFKRSSYIRVEAYSGDTVSFANPIWVVVD